MTYATFTTDHDHGSFCWACGRTESDCPAWWYGPWLIERSHVRSQPRREDIRAIVLNCSGCHKTFHGERFKLWNLPKLTVGNLIQLKWIYDRVNYDAKFLQGVSVQRVPAPEPLPMQFFTEYVRYHKWTGMEDRAELIRAACSPLVDFVEAPLPLSRRA